MYLGSSKAFITDLLLKQLKLRCLLTWLPRWEGDGEHGSAGWMNECRGRLFDLQDMQSQEGLRIALEDEIGMKGGLNLVEEQPFKSRMRFSRETRGVE